jgi:hypothetical protein
VGRYGAIVGIAPAIPRTMKATIPSPAAARLERVSVLPRNVMAAHLKSVSHWRTPDAIAPPTGSGSKRTSV